MNTNEDILFTKDVMKILRYGARFSSISGKMRIMVFLSRSELDDDIPGTVEM